MAVLHRINGIVWGAPTLVLILLLGITLSFHTGFSQITLFPKALRLFAHQFRKKKDPSSFRALCTALSATVGTGNLAGVAGAITLGGPGAVFWIWVCGVLGMVIKFAEATLAVLCSRRQENGERLGGIMYMIQDYMPKKYRFLAGIYCFFGVTASFGVGNATQVGAITDSMRHAFQVWSFSPPAWFFPLFGVLMAILVFLVMSGGARKIGRAATVLIPFAAGLYILLGAGVLISRWRAIPAALTSIFTGAFHPRAVTGGAIGSAFLAMRVGISRGVFTNEAGMGTAAIAHAQASVEHPAQQGLFGIMEVFIDTILICTLTALVILVSGVPIPYGRDVGATLTVQAFSRIYGPFASILITGELGLFAFATILGWGLYGTRCAQFLFGERVWTIFPLLQSLAVILGIVLQTGTVWLLAEIVNGLMAIPSLIATLYLKPAFCASVEDYRKSVKKQRH